MEQPLDRMRIRTAFSEALCYQGAKACTHFCVLEWVLLQPDMKNGLQVGAVMNQVQKGSILMSPEILEILEDTDSGKPE